MALTDNIVSYWKLDEASGNAADATGNGYTATIVGSPSYTTGKINNSLSLNGSSQYATFNCGSVSPTSYTISAWIYPTNLTGRFTIVNLLNGSGTEPDGCNLEVGNGSGTANCVAIDAGGWWATSPANSITLNAWNFITITVNGVGASDRKIYVNGSDVTTNSSGNLASNLTSITHGYIGSRQTSQYFAGRIDEVCIWSRALSSAEVSELYNSGDGFQYPFITSATSSNLLLLGIG